MNCQLSLIDLNYCPKCKNPFTLLTFNQNVYQLSSTFSEFERRLTKDMILRKYKLENGNETSSVFSVWRLDYEKVQNFKLQQHIKIGLEKQKSNVIRKIIYSGQGLQRNSAPFLIQSLKNSVLRKRQTYVRP